MAEISGGIAPGSKRVALAVEASQRAERGVFVELLSAIVGVELEDEVIVPYVATGGIDRLERNAATIPKASDNCPTVH